MVITSTFFQGSALYFPFIRGSPVLTDFADLEAVYEKLMLNVAPRKATWRFLQSKCWTMADLEGICNGSNGKEKVISLSYKELKF